jgi:long-chain acyl-CoA synthetase
VQPNALTLNDLLCNTAAGNPARPALVYRGQVMTYRELAAAVEGFASGLWGLGDGKPLRIGLLLPNCPAFVIACFGASRVGSVVPINVLYRPDEVRHILADCKAGALVTAEPVHCFPSCATSSW